jgi:MerR family transcriptional regulator, light-induced transcriptional regulator
MKPAGNPVYHAVHLDREYLVGKALDRFGRQYAKIWNALSARQRSELRDLFGDEVVCLQEGLAANSPAFLTDYVCRAGTRLSSRHFPAGITAGSLEVMREMVQELPADYRDRSAEFIRAAQAASGPGLVGERKKRLTAPARAFLEAALAGNEEQCAAIVDTALAGGTPVPEIFEEIFAPVLGEIGRLWEKDEAGIAKEHYVTALIGRLLDRVNDRAPRKKSRSGALTAVTACVGNELHEIGIRMVADLLRADGWEVYHVGANTPAGSIADTVCRQGAGVAAISVTMLSRLSDLDYLIRILRADKKTKDVAIIVGGYPFLLDPDLWRIMGADAVALRARDVPAIARRLDARSR